MKKAILIATTALLSASMTYAAGEAWVDNFEAAKQKAVSENKDLLIDFTGSDWCPPCRDLSARILSQESFKTAAAKNYVLVELDYPKDKSLVSAEVAAQNEKLLATYGIVGYPTVLLTDAQGRPFAQTGHRPGTPEQYLAHLVELQLAKTARDEEFAKAEKMEGVEKAKTLYAGLQKVPVNQRRYYVDVMKMIKASDPEDVAGIAKTEADKAAAKAQEGDVPKKVQVFKDALQKSMVAGNFDKSMAIVDDFVEKEELEGVQKQEALAMKFIVMEDAGKIDDLEKIADEIIAIDPGNNYSAQVRLFKKNRIPLIRKLQAEWEEKQKEEADAANAATETSEREPALAE